MTKYLLSCACGKSTPIELAQAGETITCDCGAQMAAPTMRGLKTLPVVPDAMPARQGRAWGPGQGLSFLGVAVSLAGLAVLVYFYATQPSLDLDRLSGQIDLLPLLETWRVWEMFQQGLPGPPTLETAVIMHGARGRQQLFATGCVVAVLGAVVAAIGVSYILAFDPRRRSTS
jgi:hypothetical protein